MRRGMELRQERATRAQIVLGDEIDGATFARLDLPMVVACTNCRMTMALPSALVDEDGTVWCSECGG